MPKRKFVGRYLVLAASFFLPAVARGDGGGLRFSQLQDGYQIAVFTAPTPVRVGPVDFSVFVQDASGKPQPDLPVTVHAYPEGRPEQKTGGPATTEAATNKLFRAAILELAEAGRWEMEVEVQGAGGPTRIHFEVEAAEPLPSWLSLGPWIAWPFGVIVLFGTHQLLVRRKESH